MMHWDTKTYTQTVYQATPLFPEESGIFINLLGVFKSRGKFHFEQKIPYSAVHAVYAGEGVVCCNSKSWPVRKGDLFVLRKGFYYEYSDLPEKPWTYTFFLLNGTLAESCLDEAGFIPDSPVCHVSPQNPFWMQMTRLEEAFRQNRVSSIAAIRSGWEMVECLSELPEKLKQSVRPDLAVMAKNLIDDSPFCVTNVNSLIEGLQTTRTVLFRRFRKRYGLSVKQYIEQVRFERIEKLLCGTSLPLSQIARLTGFDDPLYFSRAFKRRHGISPSQMRKQFRQGRS